MNVLDESLFANADDPGPSLEDFLATDPSLLPYVQDSPAAMEDCVRYKIFSDGQDSIEHLQKVGGWVVDSDLLQRVLRHNAFCCA